MSAKFIWMSKVYVNVPSRRKHKWGKPFKWQWAVFFEENSYAHGGWVNRKAICDSRREARLFKQSCLIGKRYMRNVKMKRRLVQANWEDYNDSFSYNAKGNGNGQ